MFALQTKQTLLFLFCFVSGLTLSTSSACEGFVTSPARLAPAEMQSQRTPGRKRGRPPLHSTPVTMAVHNLYSASAGSLPAVKIPKKRGRKPGYKVRLHHPVPPRCCRAGARVCGQSSIGECEERWGAGERRDPYLSVGGAVRAVASWVHGACCCCHEHFHKWTEQITPDWGSCQARPFLESERKTH